MNRRQWPRMRREVVSWLESHGGAEWTRGYGDSWTLSGPGRELEVIFGFTFPRTPEQLELYTGSEHYGRITVRLSLPWENIRLSIILAFLLSGLLEGQGQGQGPFRPTNNLEEEFFSRGCR